MKILEYLTRVLDFLKLHIFTERALTGNEAFTLHLGTNEYTAQKDSMTGTASLRDAKTCCIKNLERWPCDGTVRLILTAEKYCIMKNYSLT